MTDKKSNHHINVLKSFLFGMVFAVFIILILLWYLNNHPFNFKNINTTVPNKLNNNNYKTEILSFPDLSVKHNNKENTDDYTQFKNNIKTKNNSDDKLGQIINQVSIKKNDTVINNKDYVEELINNLSNNLNKNYTLQIGYFSQQNKATEYASKLFSLKLPVKIQKIIKNNNEYYKVVYQNLSYNEASSIKKLLQKKHINSIIIKN